MRRRPLAERFWEKVARRGSDDCWPWTAVCTPAGYGVFAYSSTIKAARAHRVAWELVNGQIPEGMRVLHRCDNPPCVNPAHLFLGTDADNIHDSMAKGRWPAQGERNVRAKLTDQTAREIRDRVAGGESQRSVARRYGVSQATVHYVARRKHWSHLG
jgi:hypothetical protein